MTTQRRTRVLIVDPAGLLWGSERALLDLLTEIDRSRFDVTVACPPGSPLLARLNDMKIRTTPVPIAMLHERGRAARVRALASISGLLMRMRPHVIHLNQSGIARLVAVASAPFHIPIVAHVRLMVDADLIRERARGKKSPRFAIAISQTIAQRLRGADSTVRLVYDPFRPTPPHRTRSEVRAELGIPDDVPVVCMVARLCDGKRHDLLLSAMKRIADERAHCLLVGDDTANAAGDRSYGDGLRLMAKELNLDARVTFAGLRDDVPDLLAASDVSVLPADNEAFGRVLLESLSVNTPIVGSDAGGPREIIGESERGYLFESGNAGSLATAIEAALSNGPESSRRTKAGKEWIAEVCAPSVHARLVSGIYQDAVDSR